MIDRIDVYAVGPKTDRYTWASDMSEQYMTNNIVRIHTRGGLEGIGGAASYTEYAFDRAVAETMRPMLWPFSARRRSTARPSGTGSGP